MPSPFSAHFPARIATRQAFCGVALVMLVNVLASAALAAQPALALSEAQKIAVDRSRQVNAADYAMTASREMAVAAGQLPDPVLKAGVQNLPVSGSDRFSLNADFMTMRSVGIMQEITRADKRKYRSERHEREAEKSGAEKVAVTADVQRDTAVAWLDRFYAEAMAAVVAENATQSRFEIEAAEGAYRAGRGNQSDVFSARSALVSYENLASEYQRRIANAKTMLARWVGNAAEQPLAGKPGYDTIRLDTAALEGELVHHPRIAVLARQEAVAQAEARLAQANKKPDWNVEVMYSQRGSRYGDMISFGVSIPLQTGQKNRQDRELAASLAMVGQARAEKEEMLRAHVAETRMMVNEWENNRERLARFERELIPLARERTLAAIASYRGGKASLSDVLMARRSEIDIRLQALQLEAETARLWAQLNYLVPDNNAIHPASVHTSRETK